MVTFGHVVLIVGWTFVWTCLAMMVWPDIRAAHRRGMARLQRLRERERVEADMEVDSFVEWFGLPPATD